MYKEIELLNVEIEKVKDKISETTTGMTLLGVFFLAIIPLFYAITGIYDFRFETINLALVISVAIMLLATILSIMQWEIKTKRLEGLYAKKTLMISSMQDTKTALTIVGTHKGKK